MKAPKNKRQVGNCEIKGAAVIKYTKTPIPNTFILALNNSYVNSKIRLFDQLLTYSYSHELHFDFHITSHRLK